MVSHYCYHVTCASHFSVYAKDYLWCRLIRPVVHSLLHRILGYEEIHIIRLFLPILNSALSPFHFLATHLWMKTKEQNKHKHMSCTISTIVGICLFYIWHQIQHYGFIFQKESRKGPDFLTQQILMYSETIQRAEYS